jgi:hypothetical protein
MEMTVCYIRESFRRSWGSGDRELVEFGHVL